MTKRKLPLAPARKREAETERLAEMPLRATIDANELTAAIRDGLMAFCCSAGLLVVREMMEAELTEKVGPKGRHDPDREALRNGTAPGSVVLGGRRVPLRRPRAVKREGGEIALDSYAVFSTADLLSELATERMLAGVATRRHGLVSEPIGEDLEADAFGDSRSSVSRRFVQATRAKVDELVHRDLSGLEVAVLMVDGIVFHDCCVVVALVITTDGTKVPVGLWDGDTENTVVVRDLLADLVARGLRFEQGILCVLDGGKALAAGVKRVFGKHAVVQRCVLHKRRNLDDYLAKDLAKVTDRKIAKAFNDEDAARGLRVARGIATSLEADHPSAAGSLREGLEEMFTLRRLGVPDLLCRSLSSTNCIESMISVSQDLSRRVKHWRDTTMVRRWVGAGMLEAERSFRRVKGCKDMDILVKAVRAEVAKRVAADEAEELDRAVA